MARKRFIIDLPPLPDALATFKGDYGNQHRQHVITKLLRECCLSLQGKDPKVFYSIREVADFFQVPLRTIALCYEALDMEGLLHRIRGSKTMLAGKQISARAPVNAVVGLPIWLQAIIHSPFDCDLQMELEEKLRAKGFVADSIFYRTSEECEPDFALRLLRHNLDVIIWHAPHPLSSHVQMSLRERGVRLVLLQPEESTQQIPARTHVLSWQKAYGKMIAYWKSNGFQRVVFPEPRHVLARQALRQFRVQTAGSGMEVETIELTERALSQRMLGSGGQAERDVLAFIDFETADTLCNGEPELVERIASRSRLAFCRGPVRTPRLNRKGVCVDVAELDPLALAAAIVDDLCDPDRKQEGLRKTFHAEFHPQIIMGEASERT